MYEMLLVWFFCIVSFSLGNIAITLTRKPVQRADKLDCVDNSNFCPECGQHFAVHNDDGSCIVDEPDEIDEPDDEMLDEPPEPEQPPKARNGKVAMLANELAKCLETVKDFVATHTPLPICTKVFMEFKDGIATFRTTNLETMIITTCGCKLEHEFTCVLPFKVLKELSEVLYDDIVVIEQVYYGEKAYYHHAYTNVPVIKITQGKNVCTLIDDDPLDYPPIPQTEGQSAVIMDLAEAVKKVKDKISGSDWRKNGWATSNHVNGLYFDLSKPNIVAMDNSKIKIALLNCEKKDIQFRIDKDCALTLTKFKDMECLITSNETQTRFDFGLYMQGEYPIIKTTIITQNLIGTYPDYEALKESHKELVSVL